MPKSVLAITAVFLLFVFSGCMMTLGGVLGKARDNEHAKICADKSNPMLPKECEERSPNAGVKQGMLIGGLLDLTVAIVLTVLVLKDLGDSYFPIPN